MFKGVVVSKVLYGYGPVLENMLEIKCLRKMCDVRKVKNDRVRESSVKYSVIKKPAQSMLKRFGQRGRMHEERH